MSIFAEALAALESLTEDERKRVDEQLRGMDHTSPSGRLASDLRAAHNVIVVCAAVKAKG